jgi:hypothetical protein
MPALVAGIHASASLFFGIAKGSNKNLERQPAEMRRAATLPHGSNKDMEKSRCRNLRTQPSTVMAGHSRPKDGVATLAYVPAIHALLWRQGVDARDKRGHDERWVLAKRTRDRIW